MTTIDAFKHVIMQRDCSHRTGLVYSTVSRYRKWLEGKEGGLKPSIEKMEEVIAAYGGTVVQEKIWKF